MHRQSSMVSPVDISDNNGDHAGNVNMVNKSAIPAGNSSIYSTKKLAYDEPTG